MLLASVSLAAVVVAAGFTAWLVPRLAAAGVMDEPNERSSHVRPTPRGGGLAVVVTASMAVLAFSWALHVSWKGWLILAMATCLAGLGALDDLRDLSVRSRLLAEVGAAGTVTVAALWDEPTTTALPLALVAVTYVVGATNIFNFMDGIDGIAAGTATVSGAVMAVAGAIAGSGALTALGLALAAASLGFASQNWPPARVFLGDVGSLYMGFLVSSSVLLALPKDVGLALVLVGPLLPFLVDGGLTLVRRARRGESLTEAHRSHLYQRASQRWGHARVATGFTAVALLCSLGVLAGYLAGLLATVLVVVAISAVLGLAYASVGTVLEVARLPE